MHWDLSFCNIYIVFNTVPSGYPCLVCHIEVYISLQNMTDKRDKRLQVGFCVDFILSSHAMIGQYMSHVICRNVICGHYYNYVFMYNNYIILLVHAQLSMFCIYPIICVWCMLNTHFSRDLVPLLSITGWIWPLRDQRGPTYLGHSPQLLSTYMSCWF